MSAAGLLMAAAGFVYALLVVVGRLAGWITTGTGFAALMTVLLIGQGSTMVMLGVLGEYVWRTYDEARGRPRYIVEEYVDSACATNGTTAHKIGRPPLNASRERKLNMIRVAVVGAGYWGPNLIRNFAACPATELVAVCDRDRPATSSGFARLSRLSPRFMISTSSFPAPTSTPLPSPRPSTRMLRWALRARAPASTS